MIFFNGLSSSQLVVRVFNIRTGAETDAPLPITIEVDDVNDNAPTFKDPLQFTVAEKSDAGEERDVKNHIRLVR